MIKGNIAHILILINSSDQLMALRNYFFVLFLFYVIYLGNSFDVENFIKVKLSFLCKWLYEFLATKCNVNWKHDDYLNYFLKETLPTLFFYMIKNMSKHDYSLCYAPKDDEILS